MNLSQCTEILVGTFVRDIAATIFTIHQFKMIFRNMRILLIVTVAALSREANANLWDDIVDEVTDAVVATEQLVASTLIGMASGQCDLIKKLMGIEYDDLLDDEPDVSNLTLDYRDSTGLEVFNISTAAEEIPKSQLFHPNETLAIFLHGFTDNPTKDSFTNISSAFQQIGRYNILALDSSSLIKWLYLRSTTYVRFIGKKLAEVLAAMVEGGLKPGDIHLIGHSLGAHIGGFAGKAFYNLTGERIGRISGLDPAGPCFVTENDNVRLNASDADFVDVVHTDAGVFGLTDAIGDVDFYPNGGSSQPSCLIIGCSHGCSWQYYAASIVYPGIFSAVQCEDWDAFKKGNCSEGRSFMGYGSNSSMQGSWYLQTSASGTYPYGMDDNGCAYNEDA